MNESYLSIAGDTIFVRHREARGDRPVLMLVHGLGSSGMSFLEVFEDTRFNGWGLIVPDLPGFGRSSKAFNGDYSLVAAAWRLEQLIRAFSVKALHLVGHSMGGDITTLMCAGARGGLLRSLVNVEGNLTQHDLFISTQAVAAQNVGFAHWLRETFARETVLEQWGELGEAYQRYYAELCFCRPEAFLGAARDMLARNTSLDGRWRSRVGRLYTGLKIPKVFCFGEESLSSETRTYLKHSGLDSREFSGASHAVMIDSAATFYPFLAEFIKRVHG